jgi:hypothetical protein
VLFASLALTFGALVLGFALQAASVFIPLFVVIGLAWLWGWRRGWTALADVGLMVVVGSAAIGLSIGAPNLLMLIAIVSGLTAWDLTHFDRRLRADKRVERVNDMERRHLGRLMIADACGLILAGLALTIRTNFSFGLVFLLSLLAVLALSWMIGYLRRG